MKETLSSAERLDAMRSMRLYVCLVCVDSKIEPKVEGKPSALSHHQWFLDGDDDDTDTADGGGISEDV